MAHKIYNNLEKDPRDLSVLRNFVDYHAPEFVKLIEEYIRVASTPESLARDKALADCENVMREMTKTFEAFYQKCFENDAEGLAVSSETLKRVGRVERPVVRG